MAEEKRIPGMSFESFSDAAAKAFEQVEGDPQREGLATARVERLWLEKGGVVGPTQYHVELVTPAEEPGPQYGGRQGGSG